MTMTTVNMTIPPNRPLQPFPLIFYEMNENQPVNHIQSLIIQEPANDEPPINLQPVNDQLPCLNNIQSLSDFSIDLTVELLSYAGVLSRQTSENTGQSQNEVEASKTLTRIKVRWLKQIVSSCKRDLVRFSNSEDMQNPP